MSEGEVSGCEVEAAVSTLSGLIDLLIEIFPDSPDYEGFDAFSYLAVLGKAQDEISKIKDFIGR
ncbi:hypothetical protein [Pseudorhodobacter ferrugineus]|uniref:hypothetical protein n=1 Tax=Pseudorhodobacter ferrugineus TaxID=77008 RepID=UPI0003B3E304|nr:hypothetical protein [Pseudorhodobacter ferrugineus]